MIPKYILVGCEESQAVCKAFREKGHYAYSCDLQESSGGHPEWHLKMDVFKAIEGGPLVTESGEMIYIAGWDMGIFFPTCTYLTTTGAKWFYHPEDKHLPMGKRRPHPRFPDRRKKQKDAIDFFMRIARADIPMLAIENPVGVMSSRWRKPDQIIQPFQFGHPEPKKTCLWLKNLPKLKPTKIVEPEYHTTKSGKRVPTWFFFADKKDRSKTRSKTFPGIANAMADQWGKDIKIQKTLFDYE